MSERPLPPMPSLSRWQQTRRFGQDPYGLMAECHAECGTIFRLEPFGMGTWVLVIDPALLVELHKKPEEEVLAGRIHKSFLGKTISPKASFSMDGEAFLRRRKAIVPLLTGKRAWAHAPRVRELTLAMIDQLTEGDQPVTFQPPILELTTKSILDLLVGDSVDDATYARLLHRAERYLGAFRHPMVLGPLKVSLGGLTPYGRFLKQRERIWELVVEIGEARAARPIPEEPGDVMQAMIRLLREEAGSEDGWSREMLAHEIVGLLVGGSESTAGTMMWTLHGLLDAPEVMERLRAELVERVGDGLVDQQAARHLPYLDAVINEGIRYHPIGPFAGIRTAAADVELGEYRIPEGTILAQCLGQAGRLPSIFPAAERFDPEANFLGRRLKPTEWLPFGGGLRQCFGRGMALMQLSVMLSELVRRVDLKLAPGSRRPKRQGIAFYPENGLRMWARRRSPSQQEEDASRITA